MNWIKWNTELPPKNTDIFIAMRNKNMGKCGVWLYDVCQWLGGDPDEDKNWVNKFNWETPIYWCYVNKPEK